MPVLSLDDKMFNCLRKTHGLLYRWPSGKMQIFSFDDRPRNMKPIKAIKVAIPGKTLSEALAIANLQFAEKNAQIAAEQKKLKKQRALENAKREALRRARELEEQKRMENMLIDILID